MATGCHFALSLWDKTTAAGGRGKGVTLLPRKTGRSFEQDLIWVKTKQTNTNPTQCQEIAWLEELFTFLGSHLS